ncbi:hypothetical protein Cgig2_005988 [Carnegiea gigantea]|uniref:Uncharacterized protein n=1 Tax=Carnegiea gigantea TaxID=171969 RepID=A0A9Q1KZ24_9CARY|nr:hypothetical protein Cgig2_005988 [Carnegiea gigantea]
MSNHYYKLRSNSPKAREKDLGNESSSLFEMIFQCCSLESHWRVAAEESGALNSHTIEVTLIIYDLGYALQEHLNSHCSPIDHYLKDLCRLGSPNQFGDGSVKGFKLAHSVISQTSLGKGKQMVKGCILVSAFQLPVPSRATPPKLPPVVTALQQHWEDWGKIVHVKPSIGRDLTDRNMCTVARSALLEMNNP